MSVEGIPTGLPRPARMAAILERDGGCCVWCSRPLALGDRALTFEHVVPRLKGGPAWAENEVPACRSCNRDRGHTAGDARGQLVGCRGHASTGSALCGRWASCSR